MRSLFIILIMASCSEKGQDALLYQTEVDTVLLINEQRTKAIVNQLSVADKVIHQEEQRIEHDLKSLKNEVQSLKVTQTMAKVIYVHDTILIKEKTNFWGRKRITTDTISYIDSTEY